MHIAPERMSSIIPPRADGCPHKHTCTCSSSIYKCSWLMCVRVLNQMAKSRPTGIDFIKAHGFGEILTVL
jgi:hypothetical protein